MEFHGFTWSLIFFAFTAMLGLYMLTRFYRKLPRQNGIMLLHGLGAAAAIGILFYYSAIEQNENVPYSSVFFFIVAVFGGVLMVSWDKVMNRKMPAYFPLLHAGAAITGIVLLVLYLL